MNDEEVIYLGKLFEELDINELNEEATEGDIFRKYPSRFHDLIRKILDLMDHASRCQIPRCKYQNCVKAKLLFRHSALCKTRVAGGCPLCKKLQFYVNVHAEACKESKCTVPRCSSSLKEYIREGIIDPSFSESPAFPTPELLKRALDVVVHSSECKHIDCKPMCRDPDCGMVMELFRHSAFCKIRVTGGCRTCRQVWVVIYQHSQACKESNCKVPRCRDMKERLKKSIHNDEVIYPGKPFEEPDINELNDQVRCLARQDLGIQEREEALVGDIFRNFPSHQHDGIRRLLDLMVHVPQCRAPRCKYPYCCKLKALYRHNAQCKPRSPGCLLCRKMLSLLHIHAKACKESKCAVARCSFAKENLQQGIVDLCGTPAFPTLEMLKRAVAVAVHACECRLTCQDPDCSMVKEIFDHSHFCKIRVIGGCGTCRQAWVVAYHHSKVCKEESNCKVPLCRDLKQDLLPKLMRCLNAEP